MSKTIKSKKTTWALVFPLSQIILLGLYLSHRPKDVPFPYLVFILLILGCILADIGLMFAFKTMKKSIQEKIQVEALEQRVASQREYYKTVAKQYEQLRLLRHDCVNHSQTLKILIETGRNDQAVQYAKTLSEEIIS